MRSLVVEDDPVCQKLLVRYLSEFGECVAVSTGTEALSLFEGALSCEKAFDLICLDIMLPEMSGHSALLALRECEIAHGIEESQGAKIIMTTSLNDAASVVEAFQSGCEAYITKPIAKGQLISELKKLGLYQNPN